MKILLGSCTQHDKEGFEKTALYKSMLKGLDTDSTDNHLLYSGDDIKAAIKINNKTTICSHYNLCIEMAIHEQFDWLILMHDDVSVEDKYLLNKLKQGFAEHDVIGLAGAKKAQIRQPALWHLMSNQEDWSGAVAHYSDTGRVFVTNFGDTPSRCLILDGLFLAIKVSSITDDIRFDPNIPAIAHHYDIDFSLTCNKHGLKLTTWPIWVVHGSPGLKQRTSEFDISQGYFLDKWTKQN